MSEGSWDELCYSVIVQKTDRETENRKINKWPIKRVVWRQDVVFGDFIFRF